MIKLFFLIIFFFLGNFSLKADETPGGDQDFLDELSGVKNPFESGLPKPVVVKPKPIYHPVIIKPRPRPVIRRRPPALKVQVQLPPLVLQGVIVGGGINEAIISNKVVPLYGYIDGAQIYSMSNKGVELLYGGKKFFLKVE